MKTNKQLKVFIAAVSIAIGVVSGWAYYDVATPLIVQPLMSILAGVLVAIAFGVGCIIVLNFMEDW